MDLEILAYLGAALMVVLAYLAYRYWHRTPTYARRMRESFSDQVMRPLLAPVPRDDAPIDAEVHPDETAAELPPFDGPPKANEVVADEPQEEPPETPSEPIEELIHSESTGVFSGSETGQIDAELQPGLAEDESTAPSVFTEEAPVEGLSETSDSATPDHQDTGAPEPADDAVTPIDKAETDALVNEPGAAQPADEPAETEEAATSLQTESGASSEEPIMKPEYRLIEELEPRKTSSTAATNAGSVAPLLKEIEEELAALPSGIELIDLPILERRRIADRREELMSDRELLLEQKRRGAHRRRRRSRAKS